MIPDTAPLTPADLDQIRGAVTSCDTADLEYLRRAALWLLDDDERLRIELAAANQRYETAYSALTEVQAERDEANRRIRSARTEIRHQDVAATVAMRPGYCAVSDALAAVETHLVDPEYRPAVDGKTGGE
jgi:multidrug resistance efflux pump